MVDWVRGLTAGFVRWGAVMLLAGCSALPRVVPDMAIPRQPVQVEAANGRLLSPAQSKALLERLNAGGIETSILDRHLALEQEVAGSPLKAGNAVTLL
jgi:cardiolipin synthase